MTSESRVGHGVLPRPITFLLFILMVALSFAGLFVLSRLSMTTNTAVGSGRVQMTLDHRFVLADRCVTLHWTTDAIQTVFFNDQPMALSGTAPLCAVGSDLSGVLKVVSQDNTSRLVSISGYVLFRSDLLIVGIFFGMLLIAELMCLSIVGDVPFLSNLHPFKAMRAYEISVSDGLKAAFRESTTRRDLSFVVLLIVSTAIPLIVLRPLLWAQPALFMLLSLLVLAFEGAVVYQWRVPYNAVGAYHHATKRLSFVEIMGVSASLLLFVVIAYYLPMKTQFWMGGDEARTMLTGDKPGQIIYFDKGFGRPLSAVNELIGTHLTPGSVNGFLWMTAAARFLSAVTLYALLRRLLRNSGALPMLAALLFIVNPAEPSRYLAIFMNPYYQGVFFALLSLYLFFRAWYSRSRVQLVLSSVTFGISVLIVEAAFPLSVLWPLLLWITTRRERRAAHGQKDGQFLVWCVTWFTTVTLLAMRALQTSILASGDDTYQTGIFSRFKLRDIVQHLIDQLTPTLRFVWLPNITDWSFGIVVMLIALVILILTRSSWRNWLLPRQTYWIGILLSSVAILLSILLYMALQGGTRFIRTQFFAAPAQATFWALLIVGISTFLPRRAAQAGVLTASGLLMLLAGSGALALQDTRYLNSNVSFDKVVRVVQQIH